MNKGITFYFLVIFLMAALIVLATSFIYSSGFPQVPFLFVVILISLAYSLLWFFTHKFLNSSKRHVSMIKSSLFFIAGLMPLAINLPYIWYQSREKYAIELEHLPDRSKIIGEIVLGLFLIAVLIYLHLRDYELPPKKHTTVIKTLIAITLIYAIAGSILSIIHDSYLHDWASNTAIAFQSVSHIFDDRGVMYSSLLQATGSSVLGVHSNYIYLLLYPFFMAAPRYETIIILSQICLAAAAIPLFMISRTKFSEKQSLIVVLIYLFAPTIIAGMGRQSVSEFSFLPLPFFFSLFFFEKRNFPLFSIFALVAMSTREDVGLLFALLAIFSVTQKRKWYWSVIPIIVGIGWFIISIKFLIPVFNPADEFTRAQTVYAAYGGTETGLISSLVTRPWEIFSLIIESPNNAALLYLLLQTTFGIPLLSGFSIMALPGFMEDVLAGRSNIIYHHTILIIAPLLFSLIFGLSKLSIFVEKLSTISRQVVSSVLLVLILFSTLSTFFFWFNTEQYTRRSNYQTVKEVLADLPPDATVIMPSYMHILAPASQDIRGFYQVLSRQDIGMDILQEDIVIIDERVPDELANGPLYLGQAEIISALQDTDSYKLVLNRNDLKVYVRKDEPDPFSV